MNNFCPDCGCDRRVFGCFCRDVPLPRAVDVITDELDKITLDIHWGVMPKSVSRYRQTGNDSVVFEVQEKDGSWTTISFAKFVPADIILVLCGSYSETKEIEPSLWAQFKGRLKR